MTEFLIHLMLCGISEVEMKSATLKLTVGVCVTLLGIFAIPSGDPVFWYVWGGISWTRAGLLLLTGGRVFTLMDIWSRTVALLFVLMTGRISDELMTLSSPPKAKEGAYV